MSDEKSRADTFHRQWKMKAEAGLRSALERNPEDVGALEDLCVLLLSDGREVDAEKYGRKLAAIRGSDKMSWSILRSELRQKIAGLKMASPESDGTRTTIVEQASSSGARTEVSRTVVGRTETPRHKEPERRALADTWPELLKPSDGPGMAASKSEEVRGNSGSSVPVSLDVASVLLKSRRAAEAEVVLTRLLETNPDSMEGMKTLAQALRVQKKYTESVRVLEAALSKSPNDPVLLYWLGDSMFEVGSDIQAARISLYKSVHINADNIAAWIKIGRCHLKERAYGDAVRALKRAIKMNPNNTEALLYFALVLSADGQKDRAISVLLKVVSIEDHDRRVLEAAAQQFYALGDRVSADRARQKASHLAES